jgi:RNA polymerase sigma factor (sigma-70 family)
MADNRLHGVLHQIHKLALTQPGAAVSDRALLDRFVRLRDEAAFAALVRRHGPMVLAVCRRVLRHAHDAEDACQAAFLVLARKAAAVRCRDSVGSFLHGVAYRVAARLRRDLARRRALEGPAVDVPQRDSGEATWREARAVLDAELGRLPEKFQAPLLLCYLQGKTRDEAAQELGWSLGTLRGRLDRGREMLRARLVRRGLTLSGALLATLLSRQAASAALPPTLEISLVKVAMGAATASLPAAGLVSTRVAALAAGVLKTMSMTKLKIMASVVLALALLGFGVVARVTGPLTAQAPEGVGGGEGTGSSRGVGERAGQEPPATDKPDNIDATPATARNQAESRLNLKRLAIAMLSYHQAVGHFPAPAIYAAERVGVGRGGMGGGSSPPIGSGLSGSVQRDGSPPEIAQIDDGLSGSIPAGPGADFRAASRPALVLRQVRLRAWASAPPGGHHRGQAFPEVGPLRPAGGLEPCQAWRLHLEGAAWAVGQGPAAWPTSSGRARPS